MSQVSTTSPDPPEAAEVADSLPPPATSAATNKWWLLAVLLAVLALGYAYYRWRGADARAVDRRAADPDPPRGKPTDDDAVDILELPTTDQPAVTALPPDEDDPYFTPL